jgi:myosin-3
LIASGPPPTLEEPNKYSAELNSFISDCLVKDATQRKKAAELLAHPFILSRIQQDGKKNLREVLAKYFLDVKVDVPT